MKLLRLTIHNIASIGDAVIDFSEGPLAEDSRFLICGPLGSGKTTILDAICLALYNTTPRLQSAANESYTDSYSDFKTARDDGSVGINDPRMLMRRGAASAFVELVFTDRNDNVLTALWSCSKARERADGKIQDIKWTLSDSEGNGICTRKSETEREIAGRIGLTFDQFSRTTMLAQGEFTRFLKAKDSDKSEILEKLTGTGIYSRISMSIQKTAAAKKEEMLRKDAEVSGIVLLEDTVREDISARISGSGKRLGELTADEKSLQDGRERLENILKLSDTIAACDAGLSGLEEEYRKLSSGLEFIKDYVSRQEAALKDTEEFIGKEKVNADMYSKTGTVKLLLTQALNAGKSRERHLAEEAELISEAGKLEKSLTEIRKELEARQEGYAKIQESLGQARKKLSGMDMEGLLRQKAEAEARISSLRELALLRKECMKAEAERKRIAGAVAESTGRLEELKEKAGEADRQAAGAMERYKFQEKIYEAKKTACQEMIKEIRAGLSEGDECPLCGQRIGRLMRDEEFESVLGPEKQKKDVLWEELLQARRKADSCHASAAELARTLETDRRHLKDASQEYESCHARLQGHPASGQFSTPEQEEEASALAEIAVQAAMRKIDAALAQQKTVDGLQKTLDSSKAEMDRKVENAASLGNKITQMKAMAGSASRAAGEMSATIAGNIAQADAVLGRISGWQKLWKAGHEAFVESLEASAGRYESECLNADRIRHNITVTKSVYASAVSCKQEISVMCPLWASLDLLPPAKADGLPERWSKLFADVKSLLDGRGRAAEEMERLKEGLPEEEGKDLREALEMMSGKIASVRREYDECKALQGADMEKLANDDIQRKRLGKAVAEAEEARTAYGQWYRLHEIFGSSDGKKFRNIAQSYVLRQLLSGANEYMRQLTDRYELEGQPGSLTILLKDKEAGGVLRPTSTISGGESFLASLALALGLSSLGRKDASMDILFIDEGFGTLDGTYLETVMDALERLHQMGGRKVGIISHVESLKERLTTQVRVVRVDSTLSRIEIKNTL